MMTIPTRPAPAPPGSRAQHAAAGANASIEQLRLQLQQQQQQQQQQQNGGMQRLTIKLPPPPKGPYNNSTTTTTNHYNSNNNSLHSSSSSSSSSSTSITRKFPQARYAPATNWDDSPFDDLLVGATTNGNSNNLYKKVPPPRPPPPKVNAKGRAPIPPRHTPQSSSSSNILSTIFHRKKNAAKTDSSSRVYGVSSGKYVNGSGGSTNDNGATMMISSGTATHSSSYSGSSGNGSATWNDDWNAAWSTTTTTTTTTMTGTNQSSLLEAQLISFDSPPSSPTFTQKSNSDCVSVDSFSSDSNFSSPHNGSASQPESGFEDDFSAGARSRPATTSPLDPWESFDAFGGATDGVGLTHSIGTAPVRNMNAINNRIQTNNDNPLCNGKSLLPPTPTLNMPTIIKPKISQKPKAPKPPILMNGSSNSRHTTVLDTNLPTPPSPPMPQWAPPPPPPSTQQPTLNNGAPVSIFDVISGKVDAIHLSSIGGASGYDEAPQPYGIALYDFDSLEEGDLSFRENEKIYLLELVSADWYRGRTRSGCEGIFPANYIDIKVPLSDVNTQQQQQPQQPQQPQQMSSLTQSQSQSNTTSANNRIYRVRCLYNFPAEVEGDLALRENDMVAILYKINKDWLYGENDGKRGQFPSNFLEYVPDNIPDMP